MRLFGKKLDTKIRVVQNITFIISLILSFTLFGENSQAYTGACDNVLPQCCSADADCVGADVPGKCVPKNGGCASDGKLCNSTFECDFISQLPNGCIIAGVCMGGEADQDSCWVTKGYCFYGLPFFGIPCNSDLDCGTLNPGCYPWQMGCEEGGGTCVPCVEGCSIATITYGNELESKTDLLRAFRDKYLLNNSLGKAFVGAYYKYSPPIAHYIAQREWLKSVVRILLQPVIGLISLFV